MFSSGDSNFYVPSEDGSSMAAFHTPPQSPRKPRKMVLEVVIPIPKSAKRRAPSPVDEVAEHSARRPGRVHRRDPSPARSDSSISLGSHWHTSPKKKRRRYRKRQNTMAEGGPPRPPGRRRTRIKPGQAERITTKQFDSPPLLATPIIPDSPPRPRPRTVSPFKPRVPPTSSAPRMRINLESARLETIQAQESARGYDIYHHWPTPPASDSAKTRVGDTLNTPIASFHSATKNQIYASNNAGSSTGPGTRERDKILGEQWWMSEACAPTPPKSTVPPETFAPLTPPSSDLPYHSFTGPLEVELGILSPELDKLARLGLQTALRDLVEQYGFPFDSVLKLYRSKGDLEETERVLKRLRKSEDELKELKSAAFGRG